MFLILFIREGEVTQREAESKFSIQVKRVTGVLAIDWRTRIIPHNHFAELQ